MSNSAPDKKDQEILYELDLNARQSNAQIAKKVRLSKEVVGYRIKRMLEDEIIIGFYSVIDVTKLGYLTGRIMAVGKMMKTTANKPTAFQSWE